MSNTITRTKAKRLAIVYQLAAGACVLGAVAVGVFGLPEPASAAQMKNVAESGPIGIVGITPDANSNPNTNLQTQHQTRVDPRSIAARLAMLDNAPTRPEQADSTPDLSDTAVAISNESNPISKRVRYTGYIEDSQQPMAFLRIDGAQRIVPKGGIARAGSLGLDDLTIKGVEPEYIIVTDGQTDERINLAASNGAAVTMASGADVVVAQVPTRLEDVVLSPEELAEIAKLPGRKRAIREKMLRREKLGVPPENGNTRKPLASFSAGFNDPEGTSRRIRRGGSSERSQQD